jgi:D-alanine-D-alanine ligase
MQRDPRSLGKVAVFLGGRSSEREVSLMSGNGVLTALRSLGVDAHPFDPSIDSFDRLRSDKFDRAFIVLHGRWGEDGCAQGLLELIGLPYTGPSLIASATAMDKITTKRIWQTFGLPTPAWRVLASNATDAELAQCANDIGLPLIFKAPHEGSSLGLARVDTLEQMREKFNEVAALDKSVLAESFIRGRELTVAILKQAHGHRALPVVEIIAPGGNYDFQNKYFTDVTRYDCPADIPEALTQQIKAIAEKAFDCIGCTGWGRVDFLLDAQNQPYLLEVNTAPGMTSHSLVPMAAKAIGLSYEQLCFDICQAACLKIGRAQ